MNRIRRQVWLGVAIGIALGAAVLIVVGRAAGPSPGSIIPECEGSLKELVIQYEKGGGEEIAPIYRDLLKQLPADVTVYAVCPDRSAYDELAGTVGAARGRLRPILVGHAMTCWSRDRWVALAGDKDTATLVCSRSETGGEAWPARVGDERMAEDIAKAVPGVSAHRSGLYFDAGDILADSRFAFVTARALARNLHKTVESSQEFTSILEKVLNRPVVLLKECPDHHAGMFMMAAGDNVMLVADPSLGRKCLKLGAGETQPSAGLELPGGPDFSPQTQKLFDAVAQQCASLGYRVVRMPVAPAADGRTYLTYVNALIDRRDGKRIVYMPTFKGADDLNAAAANVWRSTGYEVRAVDCTGAYRYSGTLHCLVNVLRRQ